MDEARWSDGSDRIRSLIELEENDFPIGKTVDEVRPPIPSDVKVSAVDVLECIRDWVYESDKLGTDDGSAELDIVLDSLYDRLQKALNEYIAEHVDLTLAAWQPTGRYAKRTATGWSIYPPYPDGH